MKAIQAILVALSMLTSSAFASGDECAFDAKGLAQLKVGDPASRIREAFGSGYSYAELGGGIAQRHVEVRKASSSERLYSFSLSNDDRVMFIDVYVPCHNADGIGVGSRLGDARKRYGKAKLAPMDAGYFVVFDRIPTIGFLLKNADLPSKLRNLPDDTINTKVERSILGIPDARFAQVRIYPQ